MIVKDINILFLCEEVELMRTVDFETVSISFSFQHTWTDHYILLIVDDSIQFLGRHTQKVTYLIRKGTEIPDVSNRYDEFDVTSTLTAHLLLCHLNTASVADDSLVADTLVLAAGALIVLGRTKDALAEQAVTFRLICTIINGFRLSHLTIRIFQDLLWRSETDGNLRKIILYLCIFFESHVSISKLGVLKINQV